MLAFIDKEGTLLVLKDSTLLNPLTPRSNYYFSLLSTIPFLRGSENFASNQLIIPKLKFFFILITDLVDIVLILQLGVQGLRVLTGTPFTPVGGFSSTFE